MLQVDHALYEGSQDFLGNFFKIGDSFATNAIVADEGADFYLLKCINPRQEVEKNVKDKWGNLIKRGAYYVIGLWYEVQANG